ncbi:MFS transporter [Paradesulfitobacterium aromaticivorans]
MTNFSESNNQTPKEGEYGVKTRVKAVSAGAVGNVMEWFDYGIYGTLAPIIASIFFPNNDPLASLLLTFVVFGVGFVMRPLGAVIFGYIGDKYGRKNALSLTILIMAFSTFSIGLIPSYATIGFVAPLLLTLARLLQGISTGGEWGGSTSFIVEYANDNRRGFYGSWQQVSTIGGLMLGSLTGLILTNVLAKEALHSWGWRLPFIFGIVLGIIGWYMRVKLEDTPAYQKVEESAEVVKNPITTAVRTNYKGIIQAMGMTVIWTVSFYILLTFMPSYINKILKLPLNQSLLSNFFSYILLVIFIPLMGHLSDRIGRKPLLLTSCIGFAIFTYPLFMFVSDGSFMKLVIAQLVLGLFLSMFSGAGVAFIAEIFPTNVRYTTLSIGYNIITALLGGMAPFIATFLVAATKNNLAPSFYVIGAAIVSFIAILTLPETYNKPLK